MEMRFIGHEVRYSSRTVSHAVSHNLEDVINSVCYSTYSGGPISLDQGQVKVISLAPVMLNKGHTLLDPDGPVLVCVTSSAVCDKLTLYYQSVHASDYHPQLAVGVTDGSCITTNTLRATRPGGAVVRILVSSFQTRLTIYLVAVPHAQNLSTRL